MTQSADRAFWDERYRSLAPEWDGEPNSQLVAEIATMRPGRALDAACGEGADTIWLAQHGWRVTALDLSPVALERGRAHVRTLDAAISERIDWVAADVTQWCPPHDAYDLVTAHFVQLAQPARTEVMTRLATWVRAGGTLLVVAHHPSDMDSGVRRPPRPELYYTAEEIAALLPAEEWLVLVSETRERVVEGSQGDAVVRDTVLRARRI